jgi:predicted component of type VI protein secretion system
MPLRLRVISSHKDKLGDTHLREFAACGGSIGRAGDNDWVLPDDKRFISGRHALIDYQAGAYYLVDTSRNGVYVNGADTAVGRGHPQRLFHGDRLRLGEYEIEVEIVDAEVAPQDDGMRDSIVRAQLVPVDESVELKLVEESKLRAFDYDVLERHVQPADGDGGSAVRRPAAVARPVPAQSEAQSRAPEGGSDAALQAFCKAAGLSPSDLRGSNPEEILETAGMLTRELLTGLADLLQNRSQMKDALRLAQTVIRATRNNPLKLSPSAPEALRFLLGEPGQTFLPPDRAVQAAFNDVKTHQKALFKAVIHAVRELTERFHPDELRSQFDRGLKRSALLASTNKLKYWELYEDSYYTLTYHEDGAPLPQHFIDELTRAYEQEIEAQQQNATRPVVPRPAAAS